MSDFKVVVLISGNGSNLQALIDHSVTQRYEISCVISNKADALGLERAARANLPTHIIEHTRFDTRKSFDQEVARHIDRYDCALIVLAGFMRILSSEFVQKYQGKLINIHPSLLPKFPGTQTHQRALDAEEKEHGASVHFVTEELDGGPIIAQQAIKIAADDNAESLKAKVAHIEHKLYPAVVKLLATGKLEMKKERVYLEHTLIPLTGVAELCE